MIAIALGLLMSVSTVILVESTGLYTGGFAACFQGIARVVYVALSLKGMDHNLANVIFNALFWGLYVLLNIPLTIFAYFKINKQFAKLSIVYLLTLQGLGFVWGIVPGMSDIQVFGDTSTVNGVLNQYHVQAIIFSPNYFGSWTGSSFDWNQVFTKGQLVGTPEQWVVGNVVDENITKAMLLLVYSVIFALISSACYALMFIIGASTAGSDYLTIYWSQEKNKNVGTIFIIITSISMIIGIFLGSYVSGGLVSNQAHLYNASTQSFTDPVSFWTWQYIFSANLFTSLVWVVLNGVLIDHLFPWHKLVRVEVYSNQTGKINEHLKKIKYTHPATLLDATGGYSGASTKVFLTICMVAELPKLISEIRQIDQNCLVSSSYIADIDGRMTMQRQTY